MSFTVIHAASVPAQAWRNGGGQTRELLAWPTAQEWQLRISRADIDRNGPFSAFPGVQRWFAVLEGAGVVLHLPRGSRRIGPGDPALAFDGADAPGCDLVDGPTRDLNLMVRGGSGLLEPWQSGQSGPQGCRMRGIYTTVAGRWACGAQARDLAPHSLLWSEHGMAGAWTFQPQAGSAATGAWWLGFTPQD